MIDALFKPFVTVNEYIVQTDVTTQQNKWINSVLVMVCVRLGMKTVSNEYLDVIRAFF